MDQEQGYSPIDVRVAVASLSATVIAQHEALRTSLNDLSLRLAAHQAALLEQQHQESERQQRKDSQRDNERDEVWKEIDSIRKWMAKRDGQISILAILMGVLQAVMVGIVVASYIHSYTKP